MPSPESAETRPFYHESYEEFEQTDSLRIEKYEREMYNTQKARLNRIKNLRKSIWIYVAILFLCLSIAGISIYENIGNHHTWDDWEYRQMWLTIGIALFFFVFTSISFNITMYSLEFSLESKLVRYESENIQKTVDEDIYESSIKMSYKYLDQYYLQTREQAGKGFLITLSVAVGGAVIIAVGIVAMFLGVTEPAYLTTACGVATEFIASIFFYLYNKTIQSMGDYHNKLVLSQNIAIALKVSESIDGNNKDTVKAEMIKELLKDVNQHINDNKPKT